MTRGELYALLDQVTEARANLAIIEQQYNDLNAKLRQELSVRYRIEEHKK